MRRLLLAVFFISAFLLGCGGAEISRNHSMAGRYVSAWYPDFDVARAASSFRAVADVLTEINPVWFILDTDGQIKALPNANNAELLQVAKDNGIRIVPAILNCRDGVFHAEPVLRIASDSTLRRQHAEALARLVRDNSYDGIEIDYELLPATTATNFTLLVAEVRKALPSDALLTLAIHAKSSDTANWTGPGAQNWRELLPLADRFKIMLYDYSWPSSAAGPIAPLDWMRGVLNYGLIMAEAVKTDPQKIVAALPLYGYDWGAELPAQETNYAKVQMLLGDSSIRLLSHTRDDRSGEPVLKYQRNGESHTLYYQDSGSVARRLLLLNEVFPQIGGIAFWRLGAEAPDTWERVRDYVSFK